MLDFIIYFVLFLISLLFTWSFIIGFGDSDGEYKVLFCDGELHVLEFELFEFVFSEILASILK
jgi:hypothetical protein